MHATMKKLLGTFEMVRRLGFLPDDIYAMFANGGVIFLVLKTQGKQFSITIGPWRSGEQSFKTAWETAAPAWNEGMTDQERLECLESSEAFHDVISLIHALDKKGITCPEPRVRQIVEKVIKPTAKGWN